MLAHIRLGYGKVTIRLSGVTVRTSSAEYRVRVQAFGFSAATSEKPAQSCEIAIWCSSTERPEAWRSAVSNSG